MRLDVLRRDLLLFSPGLLLTNTKGISSLSFMTSLPVRESPVQGYVNMALSVDGMVAGKNGDLDWLNNQPVIAGEDFGFADFLNSMDAMVMGRNTFEVVGSFGKEAWAYGNKPIVVWTRDTSKVVKPDWVPPSVTIQSNPTPKDLWEELKKKGYRSIYVDGGRTVQAFLEAGLIHHMTLTRVPILLGEGIPLFDGSVMKSQHTLKHQSTKSYANGFVVSKYDVVYDKK